MLLVLVTFSANFTFMNGYYNIVIIYFNEIKAVGFYFNYSGFVLGTLYQYIINVSRQRQVQLQN